MQGIGEKFSPNPQTGTGNFTIPIAVPGGRNGLAPQLSLSYSSGTGNGPFGLGWELSLPGITRKTSKGTPLYNDAKDTFILSGAEDLVPVEQIDATTTRYKPRTEGLFALIYHHKDPAGFDYWEVKSKDGITSIYGKPAAAGLEPATIAHPIERKNIFAWKLTQTIDTFGNKIIYEYGRDLGQAGPHNWDQLYLKRIRYIDYTDQSTSTTRYLVSVTFVYEGNDLAVRPDAFSDYRAGFEIRTQKRCERIEVRVHEAQERLVSTYELIYLDRRTGMEQLVPLNQSSLLSKINVRGHDGNVTEALPPVEFSYTQFEPEKRKFVPLTGSQLPASSIGNPEYELADLFGNGLPDVLQMNSSVRYWRNLGGGRFDRPREMATAPAGIHLTDPGVQLLDADGDGRLDLLVTNETLSGYYPLQFGGLWNRRSFNKYTKAPSFDLKDPEVRLLDLDGDGVTDALRSGSRFECFFNDPVEGWKTTKQVERGQLSDFPNVNFSDQRVKLADMTGDGLLDIVLVSDGNLVYWPNLGRGDWGKRVPTAAPPSFPFGYDPKRVLLGDIDGDGLADLIYVDDKKVTLWINQNGNGWSEPKVIHGTPQVTNADGVRLADIFGTGVSGLLWSRDADGSSEKTLHFLDFSGGVKPYLLNVMDNHIGATTRVTYLSSMNFYLQDEQRPETRWKTPLPFPVQVVSSVEVIDAISGGRLTTEYTYHHGYWDGVEREFRGFGRVDQRDTEVFDNPTGSYSPPTESRTWFHLGPVDGAQFGDWQEVNFSNEFWPGDAQLLERPQTMKQFLADLKGRPKRDALRTLRGQAVRTELYALDGTENASKPYTVTEHLSGVREELTLNDPEQPRIFFPHLLVERTTQWERGDDPQTTFTFTNNYDEWGQPRQQTAVALPRRSVKRKAGVDETRILTTHTRTTYATPNAGLHIKDRPAHLNSFTLTIAPDLTETQPNNVAQVLLDQKNAAQSLHTQFQNLLANWQPGQAMPTSLVQLISHSVNHYDGNPDEAFIGRAAGVVGPFGALTRTESLVFTGAELDAAYGSQRPSYLGGSSIPPIGAPAGFGNNLGYQLKRSVAGYQDGYYVDVRRQKFDFHDPALGQTRGLAVASQDALGHETRITFDTFWLLPVEVRDVAGLRTLASYDYRVFQPQSVTDPNGNRMEYTFTPLGLLATSSVRGKTASEGDGARPGVRMTYDFLAFENSPATNRRPIFTRSLRQVHHDTETDVPLPERDETIETVEYTDGFGRLLQTRRQGEDMRFGDPIFGGQVLSKDELPAGNDVVGTVNTDSTQPNVVVSGWQTYDNKGRVVEQYQPFFSTGWEYAAALSQQLGQKSTLIYDPRGHLTRTINPDGSEQRVVYGMPADITNPNVFSPSPWEAFTYDSNDNAGRTPSADPNASSYEHHWNTPNSVVVDAMGRTIVTVGRNRAKRTAGNPLTPVEEIRTRSTYDIQGNLITITDELGRLAFKYSYDLIKRSLRTENIDAGVKLVVVDALSKPVEQRDSKGAILLRTYDQLNRHVRLWAQDGSNQPLTLREKLIYGDSPESGLTEAQARDLNLSGKLYRHFDEAGLTTIGACDYKGNVIESTRQVISDAALLSAFNSPPANWELQAFRVNWESPASVLDQTEYQTSYTYDALNRLKRIVYPKDVDFATTGARKVLKPRYNRGGVLESVEFDGSVFVERIAYNAKGQRAFIAYGNNCFTRYAYDDKTFRLIRLRTEKYTKVDKDNYRPANPVLQDFVYTYDLAGNILLIKDRTPGSGIPNTVLGANKLDRTFTYDPLYRLLSATGRESDLQSQSAPWLDSPQTQDPSKTRAYQQTYTYDAGSNMTRLHHESTSVIFNRDFTFVPGSNRLANITDTGVTRAYVYDAKGNLIRENTERNFEWDHSDRMRVFRTQTPNAAPSLHAQYLYNSGGQRVKKLVRTGANDYFVTTYIDGIFEHHRRVKPTGTQENNTLHVMDDQSRIATVRVGAAFPDDGAASVPVKYHLGDHLGSSNVVLDASGALVNREEFAPYGETSFGSFAKKRYRFTGKERDEESGLYYHGARYYAPWLARWISCDPAGRIDGLNIYQYARLSPLNFSDPSGMGAESNKLGKKGEKLFSEVLKLFKKQHREQVRFADGQSIIDVLLEKGEKALHSVDLKSRKLDNWLTASGDLDVRRIRAKEAEELENTIKHMGDTSKSETMLYILEGGKPGQVEEYTEIIRALHKDAKVAKKPGLGVVTERALQKITSKYFPGVMVRRGGELQKVEKLAAEAPAMLKAPPIKAVPELTPGDLSVGPLNERLPLDQNAVDGIPLIDQALNKIKSLWNDASGALNPGQTTTTVLPKAGPAPQPEWYRKAQEKKAQENKVFNPNNAY